jgi:OOP family OmpA-OmpF porin
MRTRRRLRPLTLAIGTTALVGAVTLSASEAQAQDAPAETLTNANGGANAHLFRPPVDSKGFITVNGADVVGHLDFSLGLFLDYGYGIMPLTEGKHGPDAEYLLTHSFQGTLQFNLGVANLLTFGIAVPVVLAGVQPGIEQIGPTGGTYDVKEHFAQGVEFVALNAKIRIIRPYDRPSVGLAGILQGGVGVVGSEDLIAEPGGFIWPQLAFEGRAAPGGIFRVGLNAGFRANFGGTNAVMGLDADGDPILDSGLFEYGQQVTSSLGLSIRVVDPLDIIAETYSSFLVTGENDTAQRISAEAIAGLKVFVDNKSFLYLAGGAGYAPGFETARARGTLAFVFEPSIGDRDGDGSAAPTSTTTATASRTTATSARRRPRTRTASRTPTAAPIPTTTTTACSTPTTSAPTASRTRTASRTPTAAPILDNDKDGIPDASGQVPRRAEVINGVDDSDGCPDQGLVKLARTRRSRSSRRSTSSPAAKSVVDALIKRKIDKSRLRAMGFGEYCPLDSSSNDAAWEKNRRVEFKIVRTKEGPTGVELGCEAAKSKGVQSPPP